MTEVSIVSMSEILVSDLPTKSVTLTPLRATVVREILTTIQPGQNAVTIHGLDPKVDVDSIRIDGIGSAIITDIQTEKVLRRERFEDVYPEESDEEDKASDKEAEKSGKDYGIDDSNLQSVRKQIADVEAQLAIARGNKSMSISVSEFLNQYGKNLSAENTDITKLDEFLQLYHQRHAIECKRHHQATVDITQAEASLKKLNLEKSRLDSEFKKAVEAASKKDRTDREKRERELQEKREKRQRLKMERMRFWAADVNQVVVYLDSHSAFTPGSSRRSSIISKAGNADDSAEVTLRLTYVVPGPCWVPRYELNINTPSSSARMTYRAEFQNTSSETWRDTQVTLSTSQAAFSGLDERIPLLQAWHIRLDTATEKENTDGQPTWNNVLRSLDESIIAAQEHRVRQLMKEAKRKQMLQNTSPTQLFRGTPQRQDVSGSSLFAQPPVQPQVQQAQAQQAQAQQAQAQQAQAQQVQAQQAQAQQAQAQQTLFGNTTTTTTTGQAAQPFGAFGQARPLAPSQPQPSAMGGMFSRIGWGSNKNEEEKGDTEEAVASTSFDDDDFDNDDGQTLHPSNLEHQDSVKQDYGLTTTYDLPGRRTLVPSSVHRRHVLSELDFKSLTLTHIIVPKIRAAAFLRARVKNTSSVNIVRGRAGMTVDGTFLGTTNIPDCGPSGFFNVSLGVDPYILVTYAKPSLRRATGRFFNNENVAVFRRSCWVKNTKSIAVDLIVSDQVPLSEDEKLRVQILEPSGLEKGGDEVKLAMETDKGKGTVTRGKNGEVKWFIRLEPGKDIRLVLEYETRLPQGSEVEIAQ